MGRQSRRRRERRESDDLAEYRRKIRDGACTDAERLLWEQFWKFQPDGLRVCSVSELRFLDVLNAVDPVGVESHDLYPRADWIRFIETVISEKAGFLGYHQPCLDKCCPGAYKVLSNAQDFIESQAGSVVFGNSWAVSVIAHSFRDEQNQNPGGIALPIVCFVGGSWIDLPGRAAG